MNTLANGIDTAEPGTAAAISADIRDRADPALVRADRVEQLYSQLPLGMVATIVIGVIAAFELREGRFIELVLFWGGLLALVVVLHGMLYFGYRSDPRKLQNTAQWLRWLGIGAFAAERCGDSPRRSPCPSPMCWRPSATACSPRSRS